jgi:hypothetical protein
MIRLSPKDAAILGRVAKYTSLSKSRKKEILSDASDKAKEIGYIVIGESKGGSPEAKEFAKAVKAWGSFGRKHQSIRKVKFLGIAPKKRTKASA